MQTTTLLVGVAQSDIRCQETKRGARLQFTVLKAERGREESYTIVAWRAIAQRLMQSLTAGQHIFVMGNLSLYDWSDEQGRLRTRVQITAEIVRFLPAGIDMNGEAITWPYGEIVDDTDGA